MSQGSIGSTGNPNLNNVSSAPPSRPSGAKFNPKYIFAFITVLLAGMGGAKFALTNQGVLSDKQITTSFSKVVESVGNGAVSASSMSPEIMHSSLTARVGKPRGMFNSGSEPSGMHLARETQGTLTPQQAMYMCSAWSNQLECFKQHNAYVTEMVTLLHDEELSRALLGQQFKNDVKQFKRSVEKSNINNSVLGKELKAQRNVTNSGIVYTSEALSQVLAHGTKIPARAFGRAVVAGTEEILTGSEKMLFGTLLQPRFARLAIVSLMGFYLSTVAGMVIARKFMSMVLFAMYRGPQKVAGFALTMMLRLFSVISNHARARTITRPEASKPVNDAVREIVQEAQAPSAIQNVTNMRSPVPIPSVANQEIESLAAALVNLSRGEQ